MAGGTFGGGDGSLGNPYLVEDALDLINIDSFKGSNFRQVKNIDLSTYANFPYIGKVDNLSFTGVYDGYGYTISNLKIEEPTKTNVGLFSRLNGVVKNLNVMNANVVGGGSSGIICGELLANSRERFLNLRVDGHLTGTSGVGFMCGKSTSAPTFETVVLMCVISGTITGSSNVGGFIGSGNNMVASSFCFLSSINRIGSATSFSTIKGSGGNSVSNLVSYLDTISFNQL